jgi:hypothetical protein
MSKTCEEIYISRIENGIRGIKMGSKTPEQVNLQPVFNKLKPLNPHMCDDLNDKYIKVVTDFNNKPQKVQNKRR